MGNILLPLIHDNLDPSFCFTTWPNFLNTLTPLLKAVQDGQTFFNFGDSVPAPEKQAYPWLRTTDGRWYVYSGAWLSPVNYDANDRRLYVGSLTDLLTYDGGSNATPSDRSGPMWVEDTDFRGRMPMGPGDIPDATPSTTTVHTLTVEEQYGGGAHTLTDAEGATGQHIHAFGKYLNGAAGYNYPGNQTVPTYTGAVVQGISGSTVNSDTTANLYTLPAGQTAGGVTPTAMNIVPPVVGCYIIKPSGRLYRVA